MLLLLLLLYCDLYITIIDYGFYLLLLPVCDMITVANERAWLARLATV